jgi:hypothetical protein
MQAVTEQVTYLVLRLATNQSQTSNPETFANLLDDMDTRGAGLDRITTIYNSL